MHTNAIRMWSEETYTLQDLVQRFEGKKSPDFLYVEKICCSIEHPGIHLSVGDVLNCHGVQTVPSVTAVPVKDNGPLSKQNLVSIPLHCPSRLKRKLSHRFDHVFPTVHHLVTYEFPRWAYSTVQPPCEHSRMGYTFPTPGEPFELLR